MKQNKSFLNKLIGKSNIELEPGDILYFKKSKTYWIYIGRDLDYNQNENSDPNDISKDGIIHIKRGLWTSDYITKMKYDPDQMFKVNDGIIFHFKFKDDKSLAAIESAFKADNVLYIMTLKSEELGALNASYTLYDIKYK